MDRINKPCKFEFKYSGPDGERTVRKFRTEDGATWDELLVEFKQFLLAMGYQFDSADEFGLVKGDTSIPEEEVLEETTTATPPLSEKPSAEEFLKILEEVSKEMEAKTIPYYRGRFIDDTLKSPFGGIGYPFGYEYKVNCEGAR